MLFSQSSSAILGEGEEQNRSIAVDIDIHVSEPSIEDRGPLKHGGFCFHTRHDCINKQTRSSFFKVEAHGCNNTDLISDVKHHVDDTARCRAEVSTVIVLHSPHPCQYVGSFQHDVSLPPALLFDRSCIVHYHAGLAIYDCRISCKVNRIRMKLIPQGTI